MSIERALWLKDPFFDDTFSALMPFATGTARALPGRQHRDMPLDVKETDKSIEVQADIPGVTKEDIKLDVEKDVLSLSVESKQETTEEKEEQGVKWHHSERSHTFMKRSLRLPETADMDNIKAAYDNGVLKVVVPKREVPNKNKRIAIN